jgi:hypothetical protein
VNWGIFFFWLPVGFLFFVPVAKALKNRSNITFSWSDWHLGFDFTTSVFAAAIVQGFSTVQQLSKSGPIFNISSLEPIIGSLVLSVISFSVFLGLIFIHALCENPRFFLHSRRAGSLFCLDLSLGVFMWYALGVIGGYL